MTNNEYTQAALRTESPTTPEMTARFHSADTISLFKVAMEDCIQQAEYLNLFKRHFFYGKPLEFVTKTYMPGTVGPELGGRVDKVLRLLHSAIGLFTEAGEFLEALHKYIFLCDELDSVNLVEEAGDIFWYLAILSDAAETLFEEMQYRNIAKLRARYPDKFTEADAVTRALGAERAALEDSTESHEASEALQRYQPGAADHQTFRELINILQQHCGEAGTSEGAVETLQRIIKEREEKQQQITSLLFCMAKLVKQE